MTSGRRPSRGLVLVVEDDDLTARAMERAVRLAGYDTVVADSGEAAIDVLAVRPFDAVLCDLGLPGIDGLEVVRAIAGPRAAPVIVVTGRSDIASAVEAMQAGAEDYLTKPLSFAIVARALERVIGARRTGTAASYARTDLATLVDTARSECMRDLIAHAQRCAASQSHAIVVGEAGVGKELLARFVHASSPRGAGPFVRVHMGSLPGAPDEVLFGVEASGGAPAQAGLIAEAHGGTLVLDSVEEIPRHVQAKLLRVVETSRLYPMGGTEPRSVDVRFIATTSLATDDALTRHGMREDLYYRLAEVALSMPPLRRRREDIVPLANAFAARTAHAMRRRRVELDEQAGRALEEHDWPGNVRELRNVVERAAVLAADQPALDRRCVEEAGLRAPWPPVAATARAPNIPPLSAVIQRATREAERSHIAHALEVARGDVALAAHSLGIGVPLLLRKLRLHDLPTPRTG